MEYRHEAEYAYAVGDECGGVLTEDGGLAEVPAAVFHQEIDHLRFWCPGRDDLEQPQVPGRIEKMGAAEMLPEILASAFAIR